MMQRVLTMLVKFQSNCPILTMTLICRVNYKGNTHNERHKTPFDDSTDPSDESVKESQLNASDTATAEKAQLHSRLD